MKVTFSVKGRNLWPSGNNEGNLDKEFGQTPSPQIYEAHQVWFYLLGAIGQQDPVNEVQRWTVWSLITGGLKGQRTRGLTMYSSQYFQTHWLMSAETVFCFLQLKFQKCSSRRLILTPNTCHSIECLALNESLEVKKTAAALFFFWCLTSHHLQEALNIYYHQSWAPHNWSFTSMFTVMQHQSGFSTMQIFHFRANA